MSGHSTRTIAGQPISMVDLDDPDFERFPKFREALRHALVAELEPGDAIYIPALWWHGVQATGRSTFSSIIGGRRAGGRGIADTRARSRAADDQPSTRARSGRRGACCSTITCFGWTGPGRAYPGGGTGNSRPIDARASPDDQAVPDAGPLEPLTVDRSIAGHFWRPRAAAAAELVIGAGGMPGCRLSRRLEALWRAQYRVAGLVSRREVRDLGALGAAMSARVRRLVRAADVHAGPTAVAAGRNAVRATTCAATAIRAAPASSTSSANGKPSIGSPEIC